MGWVQSATAAEELLINAYAPIDVLVLSPEVKEPDALGLAEFVGRQAPSTAIVLVRDHTWNGLLPAAMRAGIRDVVDMTQGTEELREAVERAVFWASNLRSATVGADRTASRSTRGSIVSVFSSKGGSGKTFLTTNLATAISEVTGQDMAVVDLDVDMGDVFTYFGREPSASISDLMELGEGAELVGSSGVGVAPDTCGDSARRRTPPPRRPPVRRSASSCGRSAASSTTWWWTRPSTTRTRRSCVSTCRT